MHTYVAMCILLDSVAKGPSLNNFPIGIRYKCAIKSNSF